MVLAFIMLKSNVFESSMGCLVSRAFGLALLTTALVGASVPGFSQTDAPTAAQQKAAATAAPAPAVACDKYAEVLAGKKKGSAMLADPQLKLIALSAVDLAKCGAVAADSDELCKILSGQAVDDCRATRAQFHELRTNPKGRAFLMTDIDYENCRKEKETAPFCDGIREAARTGDPNKCPKSFLEGFCRGIISLDKSQCVAAGKIEDKESGKAACEKIIDRHQHMAKGLKELAAAGSPMEREMAKAALGQADACKPYEKDAIKTCEALTAPPPKVAPAPADPKSQPPPAPDQGSTSPKS